MNPFAQRVLVQDGVDVLPADETGTFYYIPRVQPELASSGDPTLLLFKSPQGGILQMGVQLAADDVILAKIRSALTARFEAAMPVRLQPAPFTVQGVRLILALHSGEQELQRAEASALLPSTALFRVPLTAEQLKSVEEALNGTKGRLKVIYDLHLSAKAAARARIHGDATAAAGVLGPEAVEEEALAWIEQALEDGALEITKEQAGVDAEPLLEAAVTAAKSKAAKLVLSLRKPAATLAMDRADDLASEVHLQEPRTVPAARESDVAEWYSQKKAAVLSVSTPLPPASASGVKVRLGFEAKDAPIAFVELKGTGSQPAVLRGPSWAPVTLNASGTLRMTVHYTTNAPPLVREIETAGAERALAMNELGFVQVTVDASARKEAGAKKIEITVKYVREEGEVERWPVRFQYGDWTEQWFLITGTSTLNGRLEYEWKSTEADGAVLAGGPITTDQPTIRI